jgi:hypothetical protein
VGALCIIESGNVIGARTSRNYECLALLASIPTPNSSVLHYDSLLLSRSQKAQVRETHSKEKPVRYWLLKSKFPFGHLAIAAFRTIHFRVSGAWACVFIFGRDFAPELSLPIV